ncbi:sugar phosphate isomerase/epimerase family protein [Sphingomonas jatrophae]|uniref:Sugar phosphate isomerase/epimerase n=1 Tax=Sphingomonas jatrophae TaxID=1166337 RepID=A0A1I6KK38_9SPHN|nr:TIM barrel protein [Sphingomonas jatrophae]SFR91622.1 Sugar phosphate isomerase/epimerase [Sphingomonas jatrophae]
MRPLSFNAFNGSPYLGAPVPLEAQIAAAADAGFDLIGLDRFTLDAFEAGGGRLDTAARWLAAADLRCGAITAAGMLGAEPDLAAALAQAGERARALGAPFVQVNVAVADGRDVLAQACAAVGDGVRLAIEYLPFTPLDRVTDTVALARTVGFDRAGAMIDLWHHERGPDDWDDLATVPLEAIAYVEFDDAAPSTGDAPADTVNARLLPGEGVFDCHRFAATIAALGYAGPVSVEILSTAWRGRPMRELAARAFAASRAYW